MKNPNDDTPDPQVKKNLVNKYVYGPPRIYESVFSTVKSRLPTDSVGIYFFSIYDY